MNTVKIPFRPFFSTPMREGRKTMTSRLKRMGSVGDLFEAFGETFELTHVFRNRLGFIISDCYEQEGCKSVQELMEIWNDIHPLTGVGDGDQIVYVHIFRLVQS